MLYRKLLDIFVVNRCEMGVNLRDLDVGVTKPLADLIEGDALLGEGKKGHTGVACAGGSFNFTGLFFLYPIGIFSKLINLNMPLRV